MNSEILGVILQWAALVILCYPLGRYIAKVYKGERTWLDFMAPVERFVYRICGIDPMQEMNWKQFLKALLTVNLFWFFWGMLLLVCQGWLPLNPDGNPGQSPDLAFNTCISFMVNCNLQHYSGESGLSYFTQLFVIMLFQFVTAACGMAAMAGVMKALAAKTMKTIGNFWVFLTKSVTRIRSRRSKAANRSSRRVLRRPSSPSNNWAPTAAVTSAPIRRTRSKTPTHSPTYWSAGRS